MNFQSGSSRALYSYESRPFNQLNTRLELRNSWQHADAVLGWAAQWLDRDTQRVHEVYGSLEYRAEDDRYGTALTGSIALDANGVDLPRLDTNAYLRLGSGIRLIGDIQDLFAAFRGSEGRIRWEPYLEKGFQAGLRLQFSL